MIDDIPFWLSYLEWESEKPADGIQWAIICPTMLIVLGLRNPELDKTQVRKSMNTIIQIEIKAAEASDHKVHLERACSSRWEGGVRKVSPRLQKKLLSGDLNNIEEPG